MSVSVTVGGQPATDVTVVDDTTITATAPPAQAGGAVDVVVSTAGGSATLADGFTYDEPPALLLTVPSSIPVVVDEATPYTTELVNTGGPADAVEESLRLHSDDDDLVAADVVYETKDTGVWVIAPLTEDGGDLVSGPETYPVPAGLDATSNVRITIKRALTITGTSTIVDPDTGDVLATATYEFDATDAQE